MSDSIHLDPEHGVNAHLTTCTRCGGEGRDLVLMGDKGWKCQCPCGMTLYGMSVCPKCGRRDLPRTRLAEHERIPHGLCEVCVKELNELHTEIERGGVAFHCETCGTEGVIKAGTLVAEDLRKKHGKPAPEAFGVRVSACPHCPETANPG